MNHDEIAGRERNEDGRWCGRDGWKAEDRKVVRDIGGGRVGSEGQGGDLLLVMERRKRGGELGGLNRIVAGRTVTGSQDVFPIIS